MRKWYIKFVQRLKTLLIKDTNKVICSDLKYCESFTDRMFGLLNKSNPRNLLFKTRFGIHTLLQPAAIDIVILDSEYRIKKFHKDLKPNRLFFWNPLYSLVLELPAGTVNRFQLKKGQTLKIK